MTRRSGQSGYIERKGDAFVVRFWQDVPGQEKRTHKSVRICPVSGPGKMSKPERERRAKQIIAESGADTEQHLRQCQAVTLGTTFQQQGEEWLREARKRKNKPVKRATISSWKSHLKWINAHIGAVPLADVSNKTLKELAVEMDKAGFSPKTRANYAKVVKQVVASAVNDDGEPLHPRKWNAKFIDLPRVIKRKQHTPAFTGDQITKIVAHADGLYRVLYVLLAASVLRAGEALGLEVGDVSPDGLTITVKQSVWNGEVQDPKTQNAFRQVDLHPSIAPLLLEHIGKRTSGFLFETDRSTALAQSNILRRSLHPILAKIGVEQMGFHSFRRFRLTQLRRYAPENMNRFWMGHEDETVTDGYDKNRDDIDYRRQVASNVSLGFTLPVENPSGNADFVPICTQATFLTNFASA